MNSNKNLELAKKAYPYNENLRVAYMLGLKEGYDQAMQDFLENAIIAYCEVCKMPNCVMQKQKEICPYLSKFRKHLKS